METNAKYEIPKVGTDLYVPTAFYLGHGRDDFLGGLCQVKNVEEDISAGKKVPFVEFVERPGHSYNLEYLLEKQTELKKEYGDRRGRPDPDYSPEFNDW